MTIKGCIFVGLVSLIAGATAVPASAQEKGDIFVKTGVARTKLIDKGEVYTNGVLDPAAGYTTRDTFHGEVMVGYYPIDMVALEASLSTPATTDNMPAGSLAGLPNLGSDEFVMATVGASVHPFKGPVSPYVGGGFQMQFTTPSMSTGLPVVPEKRWLSRSAPSALRVPALTSAATNQPMMKIARAPSTCGMWTPIEFCSDIHIVFQSFITTLLA